MCNSIQDVFKSEPVKTTMQRILKREKEHPTKLVKVTRRVPVKGAAKAKKPKKPKKKARRGHTYISTSTALCTLPCGSSCSLSEPKKKKKMMIRRPDGGGTFLLW